MTIPKMLEDPRDIISVCFNFPEAGPFRVGSNCSKIEAYGEQGEYCLVPWMALWDGDSIFLRIPASILTIEYRKEKSGG